MLALLKHELLNSKIFTLYFTSNCFRLLGTRKFSKAAIETTYHIFIVELTIQNLKSQVDELVRGPRALIKIFYFSGSQYVFQNSLGIKSHYDRGQTLFHLLTGEECFGTEETDRGSRQSTGHLNRVFVLF